MKIVDRWNEARGEVDMAGPGIWADKIRAVVWTASLASTADDIPAGAIAEALSRRLAPPEWALSCASRKSSLVHRLHACAAVAAVAEGPYRSAALDVAVSVAAQARGDDRNVLFGYLCERLPGIPLPEPGDLEVTVAGDSARRDLDFLLMKERALRFASRTDQELVDRIESAGIRDGALLLETLAEFSADVDDVSRADALTAIVAGLELPEDLGPAEQAAPELEARCRALCRIHPFLASAVLDGLLREYLNALEYLRHAVDIGPCVAALAPALARTELAPSALGLLTAPGATMTSRGWAAYASLISSAATQLRENGWTAMITEVEGCHDVELRDLVPALAPHLPAAAFKRLLRRLSAIDPVAGEGKLAPLLACIPHSPPDLRAAFVKAAEEAANSRYTPDWRKDLLRAELAAFSPDADPSSVATLYFVAIRNLLERQPDFFAGGNLEFLERTLPKMSRTAAAQIVAEVVARAEPTEDLERAETLSIALPWSSSEDVATRATEVVSIVRARAAMEIDEFLRLTMARTLLRAGRWLSGSVRLEVFREALGISSGKANALAGRRQLITTLARTLEEDAASDTTEVLALVLRESASAGRSDLLYVLRAFRVVIARATRGAGAAGVIRALIDARAAWP